MAVSRDTFNGSLAARLAAAEAKIDRLMQRTACRPVLNVTDGPFVIDGGSLEVISNGADVLTADDSGVAVVNLNVTDTVGAGVVSADEIYVGGTAFEDLVDPASGAITNWDKSDSTWVDSVAIGQSPLSIWRFNATEFTAGRVYRIDYSITFSGTTLGDNCQGWLSYTTDGSYPLGTSPVLSGSQFYRGISGTRYDTVHVTSFYAPSSDYDLVRFALLMQCNGSGTVTARLHNADYRSSISVTDVGSIGGLPGALKQYNASSGTQQGDNPAPQNSKHTLKLPVTWHRSYNGSGSVFKDWGVETNSLYQGYFSDTHGNTSSLFGIDSSTAQAKLAGATITDVKLTFKAQATWNYSGAKFQVCKHGHSSKPGSFSQDGNVGSISLKAGETGTVDLDNSIGDGLKSGSIKGFGFNTSSDGHLYYCRAYGGSPVVVVKYTVDV